MFGAHNDSPGRMQVLGVPVSLVNLIRSAELVTDWAQAQQCSIVLVRDVASLELATEDEALLALHHQAKMIVPDGTPLVWLGRLRGYGALIGRVPGADLVDAVCARSLQTAQSHFFYGGKPGVAEEMVLQLSKRNPGLRIAGILSPPLRTIDSAFTPTEAAAAEIDLIRSSGADFVWVGLSSPKQEFWISKAAPLVGRGVFIGVGAAFDFHSGSVTRAPPWMRDNGLEWLHRLLSEPRRLWRRYLVLVPKFVVRAVGEEIKRLRGGVPEA